MSNDVHIDELLSAYLAGDVTPSERAAIEHRLANTPALQHQLAELQQLAAILKQAQRPVTPAMLAELRRRVASSTPKPVELLSASLTGDLNSLERASVDQLLKDQPAAQRELASLQAMSSFLKKAELTASKTAGRKLADRLSAKLPAKALSPLLPSANETVAIKLYTSAPTARIYVAQETPWRKRILRAAAAVAAAIVFATGAIFGLKALSSQGPESVKGPLQNHNQTPVPPDNVTPENPILPAPNSQAVVPTPPIGEIPPAPPAPAPQTPPTLPVGVTPANEAPTTPASNTVPAVVPHVPKTTPRTPDVIAPAPSTPAPEPKHGPDPEPALDSDQQKVVKGGIPIIQLVPNSPNNGIAIVDPNKANQPSPTVDPTTAPVIQKPGPAPSPTPNPTPAVDPTPTPTPAANSFVAAVDGKMVAAVVREGGDATAITPQSVQTIQQKDELPSDTTITTGNTRIGFVLPQDGRLWVNKHSKVTVQLHGANTTVLIESGEVSYRAPVGGSVTINHPSGLTADSSSLMDVAIDDASSTLVAYAITAPGKVLRKAKSQTSIPRAKKAVAKIDLSSDPVVQTGSDTALLWQADLNVNGDSADGQAIKPANEKSKSRKSK